MTDQTTERLCACFGDSGLHASTHVSGGRECCDMCGWPIQPQSVDVLTALNSLPPDDGEAVDTSK